VACWWLICVAVTAGGCYRPPADEACSIRCDLALNLTCPSSLACGTDNRCFADTPCDQLIDIDAGIDSSAVDAPISNDGRPCYGTSGLLTYCPPTLQLRYEVALGTQFVDTDDPVGGDCTDIFTSNGIEFCVVAADIVQIIGTLRADGARPLLVFGRTDVSVSGVIDVSNGGAGTTPQSCAANKGAPQLMAGDSPGGGAGGSYGGMGGPGGAPNQGIGTAPDPATQILYVRGGCHGGAGGTNADGGQAGGGGLPGGAVYLLSPTHIRVTGTINASGAGGGGGDFKTGLAAGGGGGGSGGLIGLDAMAIDLAGTTVLLAQGGGGGGGCSGPANAADGMSPSPGDPANAADGGTAIGSSSGAGGAGSGGASPAGTMGGGAGGGGAGGGGGGGAGAIRFWGSPTFNGARVYPPS